MKATTTRRLPPLRSKRPALLERPSSSSSSSLLGSTSTAMLSFLARLSGRRRRWRQALCSRDDESPGRTALASMCEDEAGCARCRAHSCCSCELLGLDLQHEDPTEPHCRRSRHAAARSESEAPSSLALQRRRPPERTQCRNPGGGRGGGRGGRYLAVTLLCLLCVSVAEACSSRSTPKAKPPAPTPRPNITFHMYTCPPDYAEWYCLNGATCFTVKIVDSLLYNCICANGYIGQRCEFKDLEGSYMQNRHRVMLETASIAGAVTIAVFLAVITFISVYIHCKRKQKELRMLSNGNGVDVVDGPPRDPELRPFCSRSRSLMIFMAKNPNSTAAPPIQQTRMPNWNYPSCPPEAAPTRMSSVNESKRPSH